MDTMLDLCKKYAFFDREIRLYLYFLLGTVSAFLGRALEPLPRFYLTQKRNILNDYVVKLGLFWTSTLMVPFIFFTAKVYGGSNYFNIARQLSRMLVNFVLWFVITAFVIKMEHWTGICSLNAHDMRSECLRNGGSWFAFEISGHCFLLTYCSLTIAEELLVFRHWHLIPKAVKRAPLATPNNTTKPDDNEDVVILDQYRSQTPVIQALFIASTVLMLLWDIMFLITNLYYHTWLQNVTGLAISGTSWYITYGLWYRTPYSPGMPGDSRLMTYIDSRWKVLEAAAN